MNIEIRSGSVEISGYVNVPGRMSNPVITPHGRVIETIKQGAFSEALKRGGDKLVMLMDHNKNRQLASVEDGTLDAKEDAVGFYAHAIVKDPEVINAAKDGKIKGWSFSLENVKDDLNMSGKGLPVRTVKDFDMKEISLILNAVPCYSSTSVEVRAGADCTTEVRAVLDDVNINSVEKDNKEKIKEANAELRKKMESLINH